MSFRPHGDSFEMQSPLPPVEVKALLRAKFVGWFQVNDAPRGWIVGSFLCIWNSAFDSHGPMVLARIQQDGAGTRISGRAGSNLNGLIWLAVLGLPLILSLAAAAWLGRVEPSSMAPLAFILPIYGLALWGLSHFRKDAAPLVNFINRTVAPSSAKQRQQARSDLRAEEWALIVNDLKPITSPNVVLLREALISAEYAPGDIVVLKRSDQRYIQAISEGGGLILEKREGGADRHFRACEPHEPSNRGIRLNAEQVLEAMVFHLHSRAGSHAFVWRPAIV